MTNYTPHYRHGEMVLGSPCAACGMPQYQHRGLTCEELLTKRSEAIGKRIREAMRKIQLTDGSPVPDDHSHTRLKANGQQEGYVVLTPEERAKGFVKPVRHTYVHVGSPSAPTDLRDLTPEQQERYSQYNYVKFEPYGEDRSPITGKYWTQAELNRAGRRCGGETTMGSSLAETYARDPNFYSGTFCCKCGEHFPLNEFVWGDGEPMYPPLQAAWAEQQKQVRREARQRRIEHLRKELAELESISD